MCAIERSRSAGIRLSTLSAIGREAADPQVAADDDDGNLHAADQVDEVAVDAAQLVVARLQLIVDRVQLFVGRLQFLLGGVELLVGALQLLVARQDLFVRRLQLLVGGLELLDDRSACTRGWPRARAAARSASTTCVTLRAAAGFALPRASLIGGEPRCDVSRRTAPGNAAARPPLSGTTSTLTRSPAVARRARCRSSRRAGRLDLARGSARRCARRRAVLRAASCSRLRLASPGAGSRNGPVCPRNWTICRSRPPPRRPASSDRESGG